MINLSSSIGFKAISVIIGAIKFMLIKRAHVAVFVYLMVIFFSRILDLSINITMTSLLSALLVWGVFLDNLLITKELVSKDKSLGIGRQRPFLSQNIDFYLFLVVCLIMITLAFKLSLTIFTLTLLTVILGHYLQRLFIDPDVLLIDAGQRVFWQTLFFTCICLIAVVVIPSLAAAHELSFDKLVIFSLAALYFFREIYIYSHCPRSVLFCNTSNGKKVLIARQAIPLISILMLIIYFALLVYLGVRNEQTQFNSLMNGTILFLLAFFHDERFIENILKEPGIDACNYAFLTACIFLFLFLVVPGPINIFVLIFLRVLLFFNDRALLLRIHSSFSH